MKGWYQMRIIDEVNELVKMAGYLTPLKDKGVEIAKNVGEAALPYFYPSKQVFNKKDYGRAYSFYEDIAPEIRKLELGVDTLPENEQKAFREILDVPVLFKDKMREGTTGHYRPKDERRLAARNRLIDMMYSSPQFYDEMKNKHPGLEQELEFNNPYFGLEHIGISPSEENINGTLVHELRHALEARLKNGNTAELDKLYRFSDFGLPMDEMPPTNKEHQFRIYNGLWNKLGRKPTANEYFHAVENDKDVPNLRQNSVNGYQDRADMGILSNQDTLMRNEPDSKDRRSLTEYLKELEGFLKGPASEELYRKAMKQISRMNNTGRRGWNGGHGKA